MFEYFNKLLYTCITCVIYVHGYENSFHVMELKHLALTIASWQQQLRTYDYISVKNTLNFAILRMKELIKSTQWLLACLQ